MKKFLVVAVMAAMVFAVAGQASAAKVWDDMSWWGNTGATPLPQPDTHCGCGEPRSGYWWWPTEPASNVGDAELWGNRGIVYHAWEQPAAPEPTPEPVPQPAPARTAIVLNNVLFDFDKAVLKPEGKAEVDKLIAEMKQFPGDTVVIEGHASDEGSEAYNMALGQRRADAVKNYMIQSGVDAARITTVSYGESRPAVPNTDEASRKLNRRAQFNITIAQ